MKSPVVNFRTATLNGQAPDKGLYFPTQIPTYTRKDFANLGLLSLQELAFNILKPYINDEIPEIDFRKIIENTFKFEIPLNHLNPQVSVLDLAQGPTLAFKDAGALFLSSCLNYFLQNQSQNTTVLVATSGDTGGAVANGFKNTEGINVVILYPLNKVSTIQELQLTTGGDNVYAIAIEGNFDDCQNLVKEAFLDTEMVTKKNLTSANSINVARWLPQQIFYFWAWQQWQNDLDVLSIPSGNFGNLAAACLALKSGLPIHHLIAACNANKIIPDYLNTQIFRPRPVIATLANAMDVANPSNFIRIENIFDNDFQKMTKFLSAFSAADNEIISGIKTLYQDYNYVADPHGAVAFLGLQEYLKNHPDKKGIFVETAHPVKFPEIVEKELNIKIPPPASVQNLFNLPANKTVLPANFTIIKDWIMELK